jgi:hypothetical protein
MTNEQALMALSKDNFDEAGVAAIAENNADELQKTIRTWFNKVESKYFISERLVRHVANNAKFFRPLEQKADRWIKDCADRGCSILSIQFGVWVG